MSDNKNVNNKEKGFVVGGYTFKTKQEAQEAKDEMNAIKYLSGKTDSKDPKQVYVLYNKIIDRQLFYTSIGLNYLKNLQRSHKALIITKEKQQMLFKLRLLMMQILTKPIQALLL